MSGAATVSSRCGSPRRRRTGPSTVSTWQTAKLGHARNAVVAAGLGDRVSFDHIGPGWEPAASEYDAAVVADVIYLLGRA